MPWTLENQIAGLYSHLSASLNTADGRNSLWRIFGLTTRATRVDINSDSAKLDLILDFLQTARSREAELPATEPSGSDREASIAWLVLEAQKAAAEVNARLKLKEVNEDNVIFDLGLFRLTEPIRKEILGLGSSKGLSVQFLETPRELSRRKSP